MKLLNFFKPKRETYFITNIQRTDIRGKREITAELRKRSDGEIVYSNTLPYILAEVVNKKMPTDNFIESTEELCNILNEY